MALFGFKNFGSKLAKNKTFSYTPLYYDPVKEKLDNITGRENPNMSKEELIKSRMIHNMRRRAGIKTSNSNSAQRNRSNLRLVLIIGILTMITYLFLQSDGILNFINQMSN